MPRQTRRVFVRYLISYFLVLLLPLTFITVFNLRFLRRDLVDYVMRETELRFEQIVDWIDGEYEQLFAVSSQILNSSLLADLSRDPNYKDVTAAKLTLTNYVLANDFVDEIFLIDKRSDRVLTSSSYVNLDFFFRTIYRLGGLPPQQILSTITQIDRNTYFDFSSASSVMEQTQPSGAYITSSKLVGLVNSNLFLGFILHKRTLDEIAVGRAASPSRQYVLTEGGVLVYHHDPEWKTVYPELLQLLEFDAPRGTAEIAGVEHFFFLYQSRLTGLQYVYLVPREAHFAGLDTTMFVFVVSLVLCVTLSSLVIVAITTYNYRPIKRLLQYAPAPVEGDEFQTVERAMQQAREDNKRLVATVRKSRNAVAERIVGLLLKNEIGMSRELEGFFRDFNIPLESEYQVVVARPETALTTTPTRIVRLFRRHVPRGTTVFGVESIVNRYLIFMLFHRHPVATADVERGLDDFRDAARTELGMVTTVGVGRIYAASSDIATSYVEAISCLDYSIVKGCGARITAEDVHACNAAEAYPAELLSKMGRILENSDVLPFLVLLEELEQTIITRSYPLYLIRMTVYDVIVKTQSILMADDTAPQFKKNLIPRIESLASMESVESIFDEIRRLLGEHQAAATHGKTEKMELILDYIAAHGTEANFSATVVADAFGMERASFSQYFKRHAGRTFLDYVGSLRLEKACELLISTDLPLSEIVQRIGYSDSSAFIKKFRKHTGTTPLSYRKNQRDVTT